MNAKHILERLKCCRAEESAAAVRQRMEKLDFDAMGIEDKGEVDGYVERSSLGTGLCRTYKIKFVSSELIQESTPLIDVFLALRDAPRKFVTRQNKVTGIITRGDLQKAAARMWMFGLITLLEMHLLRIIRSKYLGDSWTVHLSDNRIKKAKALFALRKKRNEAIDLADCLQFCDKRKLVLRSPEIGESMRKQWGNSIRKLLESAEEFRDKLFHAQDLVVGSTWQDVIDLMKSIENLLKFLENHK